MKKYYVIHHRYAIDQGESARETVTKYVYGSEREVRELVAKMDREAEKRVAAGHWGDYVEYMYGDYKYFRITEITVEKI